MKFKRKVVCILISHLILITTLLSTTILSVASGGKGQDRLTDNVESTKNNSNLISYYAYLEKFKGSREAANPIILNIRDGKVSEENARLMDNYNNKETVVNLSENGYIEWDINVPQSAFYYIDVEYQGIKDKNRDIEIFYMVDGAFPYSGSDVITLKRTWKDAEKIKQDKNGNDLIPRQEEIFLWKKVLLTDFAGFSSKPYKIFFESGKHKFRIGSVRESVSIANIELKGEYIIPTYQDVKAEYDIKGYKPVGKFYLEQQAENTSYKSDQMLYPVYDRSDPATKPYNVSKIKRNTIGQRNWSKPGMSVSYEIEVEQAGLYLISVKYRQNYQIGMSTFRNIYVNGEIPFKEMENVDFPYDLRWKNKTLKDRNGEPCYVYLKKGINTITFEATTGKWSDVFQEVEQINYTLNDIYRKITMITSTQPDPYRDYMLDVEIPGLVDTLKQQSKNLFLQADKFDELNGEKSTQSETLRRVAEQLASFAKDPETMPSRLSNYRNNISAISSWLLQGKEQPLEMDYFIIHSAEKQLPKPTAGFWAKLRHNVLNFFVSFVEDYSGYDKYEDGEAITVWTSDSREMVQVMKDMIENGFTSQTGIKVNLSLVQGGFIEATLAGTGPDIALGVSRGQTVNLACRGALVDLSQFATFKHAIKSFDDDAMVPYEYNGKYYGLPNTQVFFMMFYRTTIFKELGLKPPDTWGELYKIIPVLQRNNMSIGLPYTAISAQGAVDAGLGSKDIFPALLLQYGGSYYNNDKSATALNSPQALDAFKMWTNFYTKYSFDLTYDFNTRFRTGEMPLGIAPFTMYNVFAVAAPEIRNQWDMVPIPGIKKADGTIDRSVGASGSAAVIFSTAKNKENCWKFLDWWSSAETQYKYGMMAENIMGIAGRYIPANLEAFERLPWSKKELDTINLQRKYVKEIPEVPGSYYVSRSIDNAFRSVVYSNSNPREMLDLENDNINREIMRKRIELGLDKP